MRDDDAPGGQTFSTFDPDHTGERTSGARAVDQQVLMGVLDAFAATVSGDFTAQAVLNQLASAVTEVLSVDGAGVMVAEDGVLLRFTHAAGPMQETVAAAEHVQELLQSGPCRDSHLTGEVVNIGDLAVEGSWPEYQARVAELGLHAVAAIPLRARDRSWGVLDLYRSWPYALAKHGLAAARTLANLATSYLVISEDRQVADRAQAELAHRAMHDVLTGLPVRWVLLEAMTRSLARLARHGGQVAVLFVDLDGLKYVNDTHGHGAGDDLLVACAARIQAAVRPGDLVARVGGDEFVVLVEDLPAVTDAVLVAHRVLAGVAVPLHVDDSQSFSPSASIGVATTDDPHRGPGTLIAHADAAMYRAKRAGRGRVEVLDPADYESGRARATDHLLPALRKALDEGHLELHYQPVYDFSQRQGHNPVPTARGDMRTPAAGVHAVEALMRWHRPGHGLVPAGAFIAAAEAGGLITELGAWALATACAQLATWDTRLGDRSPRQVLVNISAVELADPDLPARVQATLRAHGLASGRLVLEITETALTSDTRTTTATLTALVELGCALAVDDFGTGYSSLRRVIDLPATTLKVDKSFTRDLVTNPAAAAVTTAALGLGRTLGRTVVVEGVEDQATLQALLELGATHLQGYHLAHPLAADALSRLLLGPGLAQQPEGTGTTRTQERRP